MKKVIIIGSGPAAHTAAIYCSRANLLVKLYEGELPGGQLQSTTEVENFPGFPDGILGPELCDRLRAQSVRLGVEIVTENVTRIETLPLSANGEPCDAMIIATGAKAKTLDIPGKEFWQRGISACAVCDGALPCYRNKPMAVVGGGDTAVEEAMYLSKYASIVYVLHRRDKLRASAVGQQRLFANPKVKMLWNTEVKSAHGGKFLESLIISTDDKESSLEVNGLFYAIGHEPCTEFLDGQIKRNNGYLLTHNGHTNVPGIFAAGDVQDPVYRQAITAAGSGCVAALEAIRWLDE